MEPLTPEALQNHLENQILAYWINRLPDEEHGGFYGRIDGNDRLHPHADKAIILYTRILWIFSAAYRRLGDQAYLKHAKIAQEYIMSHFLDEEYGGVYWSVDFQGNPRIRKKQVYAQSFAIYALSEFYMATGDETTRNLAIEIFRQIEAYAWDPDEGGYIEALDRNWGKLEDMRLSEKDLNAPKTMNTHLHILEAYTNLSRICKDHDLIRAHHQLIDLMCEKFVRNDGHFHLFFNMQWDSLSSEVSYGHDIEGSWLIWEALEVLGDKKKKHTYRPLVLRMVRAALEGLDDDGGLMNEGVRDDIVDTDKHWWPQAEAMVGLINAWQMTGDDFYVEKAVGVWKFIQLYLVDHDNGEWFWRVNREGLVNFNEDKAGPWKCPYHNGRAMIELITRLQN